MKLASDRAAGFWTPRPPTLEAVLARLGGPWRLDCEAQPQGHAGERRMRAAEHGRE